MQGLPFLADSPRISFFSAFDIHAPVSAFSFSSNLTPIAIVIVNPDQPIRGELFRKEQVGVLAECGSYNCRIFLADLVLPHRFFVVKIHIVLF